MTRSGTLAGVALCAALAGACGGSDENAQQRADAGSSPAEARTDEQGIPAPTIQTGCITESDGRYVLTDLESSDTQRPTTETYQLVGNEEELRKHIGREVRVSGEVEPAQVAEVRETAPATGTAGRADQQGKPDPEVTTQTQTRIEVSRLRVASVTPTGDPCVTAPAGANPRP